MGRFPKTSISSEKSTVLLRVVVLMKKGMTRKIIVTSGKNTREEFLWEAN